MKVTSLYSIGIYLLSFASVKASVRGLEASCSEPTESDFTVPTYDFDPQGLPILHQLLIGILQAAVPSISEYETPIAIRLSSFVDMADWNCVATYHASFKSALATSGASSPTAPAVAAKVASDASSAGLVPERDLPLIRSMKNETYTSSSRIMCAMYANANLRSSFFGTDPSAHDSFFESLPAAVLNLTTSDLDIPPALKEACPLATDSSCLQDYAACHGYTPKVMGAIVAYQIAHFSQNDGWNSNGVLTKDSRSCSANCRPYQDPTSYDPEDAANVTGCRQQTVGDSDSCWVPLLEDSGKGYFTRQEHVTPHIGPLGTPRANAGFQSRSVAPPNYNYPEEMDILFERVRDITDEQKMLIELGDNKIDFALTIVINALQKFGPVLIPFEKLALLTLTYTSSEYDGVLTVWNEKVRHNKIRPTTVAQRLSPLESTTTYVVGQGVSAITRGDFLPYIRTMPHAEYPSGSSCLFEVVEELINEQLSFLLPGIFDPEDFVIVAQFPAGSSKVEPGMTPKDDLVLQFKNLAEFTTAGSESRLDGGMHFRASVPAGKELCNGIGSTGVAWAQNLVGNVAMDEEFKMLMPEKDSDMEDSTSSAVSVRMMGLAVTLFFAFLNL